MPWGFQLSVTSLCIPLFIIHYSSIHHSWLDTSWSQVCVFQPEQQELGGKRLCRDLEWWRKGGKGDFSEWWWGLPPFQDYKKTFLLSSIPTVWKSFTCNKAMLWVHTWIYPTRISFNQGYIYQKLSALQHTYNSICETHCIVSNHKRRLVCIFSKSHLLIASGEEAECKTMINRWNFLHKDIKQWRNGKTIINRWDFLHKKDIKQRRNYSLNLAVNIGICYAVN